MGFQSCLDIIPFAADMGVSSSSIDQLFSLIIQFWQQDPNKAYIKFYEFLCEIGDKLYSERSPFYNLLRTHFDLYDFPLEPDVFVPKPILEKRETAIVGVDEITWKFHSTSNGAFNQKKKVIKYSKI